MGAKPETLEDMNRTCGICLDVVLSKPASQRLFAILPNCNHCFCVSCIRTWRKQRFANRVTRGCPECRTVSLYYVICNRWIADQEEKNNLCLSYKRQMAEIPCKYFLGGGCAFGRKCFYKHDGGTPEYTCLVTLINMAVPTQQGLWWWPCLWYWH